MKNKSAIGLDFTDAWAPESELQMWRDICAASQTLMDVDTLIHRSISLLCIHHRDYISIHRSADDGASGPLGGHGVCIAEVFATEAA